MSAEIESLNTEISRRRSGGGNPMLVALTIIALLLALFAHWRFGQFDERIDRVRGQVAQLRESQELLQGRLQAMSARQQTDAAALRRQVEELAEAPVRIAELGRSLDELRARTEAPQRVWIRAEALYLLKLAESRLELEHDTRTAIAAMEAADARLATVTDPRIDAARDQLGRELSALRAVPEPDLAGVHARLVALEQATAGFPVLGVPVSSARRMQAVEELPRSAWERAWKRISEASRDLVAMRRVDPATARLVTAEEEALRRQHLEVLLFAARIAVQQQDELGYQDALRSAGTWLTEFFDEDEPDVAAALVEIDELAAIDIVPPRPDIGEAANMLERMAGGETPP
jgi:uncharacterized protein HemX